MVSNFDLSNGRYLTSWMESATTKCPHCIASPVQYRIWENRAGMGTDCHYRCLVCSKLWWVEGESWLATENSGL
jgi:hypothetical protein